jgi:hypothetical protein
VIHQDAAHQALLDHLSHAGPSDTHAIAAALDRHRDDVAGALAVRSRAGVEGHGRRDRWATKSLSLRMPQADESWARPYLDRKYDDEVRLLTNAARRHAEMGPWGKGERERGVLPVPGALS